MFRNLLYQSKVPKKFFQINFDLSASIILNHVTFEYRKSTYDGIMLMHIVNISKLLPITCYIKLTYCT